MALMVRACDIVPSAQQALRTNVAQVLVNAVGSGTAQKLGLRPLLPEDLGQAAPDHVVPAMQANTWALYADTVLPVARALCIFAYVALKPESALTRIRLSAATSVVAEIPLDLLHGGGADPEVAFGSAWADRVGIISDPPVWIPSEALRIELLSNRDLAPGEERFGLLGWLCEPDGVRVLSRRSLYAVTT